MPNAYITCSGSQMYTKEIYTKIYGSMVFFFLFCRFYSPWPPLQYTSIHLYSSLFSAILELPFFKNLPVYHPITSNLPIYLRRTLRFLQYNFPFILLGTQSSSIFFTCPNHHIPWDQMILTIFCTFFCTLVNGHLLNVITFEGGNIFLLYHKMQ